MFNQLQVRPQSRSYRSQVPHLRPITRQNDTQQGQKCFILGKQHQSRNEMQKAQKFYIQATIHNPLHYKAYCNLGLCYKIQGRYGESINAYTKSLQINSKDEISHYNLANVYRLIGNYEKSIQHYLSVIENHSKMNKNNKVSQNQTYLDSYNNLGVCFKIVQNYHKAVECFQNLLKIKPQDQQVLFNLAVCKLRMVRKMVKDNQHLNYALLVKQIIQQTQILFTKVLQKNQRNQVATIGLIQLHCLENLQNQPKLEKSIIQLDAIIKSQKSSTYIIDQALKLKAYCLSLLKKYQQSAQQYQKAVRKQKQDEQNLRKQKQRQKRMDHDKEIQKIRKEQQIKAINQNKLNIESMKKIPASRKGSISSVKSILDNKLPTKIEAISTIVAIRLTQQQFDNQWSKVQSILISVLQKVGNNSEDKQQDAIYSAIDEVLSKNEKIKMLGKQAEEKIRRQLQILSYCLLGQRLNQAKYFSHASQIYFNNILNNNLQTVITQQFLHLSTHRVIANLLTTMGHNQKAIEHYQIISHSLSTLKQKHTLTPFQEQLHSGLAINYQSQGYYNQAIQEFNNAISTNPQNYTLYYNLAYCQHCQAMNSQAILNYSKFLTMLQKDNNISNQQRLSYFIQAKISIFLCENQTNLKVSLCVQIINKLSNVSQENNISLSNYVDDETLLKFYLPACDMFEQLIYGINNTNEQFSIINQSSNKVNGQNKQQNKQQQLKEQKKQQQLKQYKEYLFKLYINLLNINNCPDKQQILINCGNLLFQQKQYLNALTFYQKVHKTQNNTDISNMIGLTLLHINQHQKTLEYLTSVNQQEPQNIVYRLNLQLIKWAYGIQTDSNVSLLYKRYPCHCDSQFNNRVQLTKSYILKLTNYLQKQIINSNKNINFNNINNKSNNLSNFDEQNNDLSEQKLIKFLFNKEEKCWKSKQHQNKHNILQNIIQKHCTQINHTVAKSYISQADTTKQLMKIIQKQVKSYQDIKSTFSQLKQKLSQPLLKKHFNYLHLPEHTLSYFIYYHTTVNKQNQTHIIKLFTQLISNNSTQTQQITFPTEVIQNSQSYPSKSYSVIYPKIQLKLQNLIQSLSNWQLKLQDQFTYLIKIIETLAYNNQIDQAIFIQYNFPYCKNLQNCQQCLEKAINIFPKMLKNNHKNYSQETQQQSKKYTTFQQKKKNLTQNFISHFASSIQPFLPKSQQQPQQSILTLSLSQSNLPITLSLHFPSQTLFQKFIKDLSKQLSIPQIKYQSTKKSLIIILNKLISFKCEWKQHDYVNEFIENLKISNLTFKQTALLWLDDDKKQ